MARHFLLLVALTFVVDARGSRKDFEEAAARVLAGSGSEVDFAEYGGGDFIRTRILAIAARHGIEVDDRQDVLQDVRVRMLKLKPSGVYNVVGLVDRMAEQVSLNHHRRVKAQRRSLVQTEESASLRQSEREARSQAAKEEVDYVREAVLSLKEVHRTVLQPYLDGIELTYEEGGALWGISAAAYKSKLKRARERLEKALVEKFGCWGLSYVADPDPPSLRGGP